VVHIIPAEAPEGVRPATIAKLTEAGFGQRRKMLRSSLGKVSGALDALNSLGIDLQRRAETLSVADWIALARKLES
jgi:16S rRNA (adenine1518-N6/adenine1519-N6)-dimethyltransferase